MLDKVHTLHPKCFSNLSSVPRITETLHLCWMPVYFIRMKQDISGHLASA